MKNKAMELLRTRTLEELVADFEATTNNNDKNIYTVRGWLMDAIQERNPEGFDKFLDCDNCEDDQLKLYVL